MIDDGIYLALKNDADVHALVNDRIFAVAGPDDADAMPYIVYSFVGGDSEDTLDTSGVQRQRVQIDAYAIKPSGALPPGTIAAHIRNAVIRALDGWAASLADGTRVLNTTLQNTGTDFCTEQRIYRCMCEFYVLYTNP